MNINNLIDNWRKTLFRRRKITVFNNANNTEWYTHISVASIMSVIMAVVLIILFILLLLVSYTPLLEILPQYKTYAERSHERLILNIERLDSMERIMNDMTLYNHNVAQIMDGKTPVVRSQIVDDSIKLNKDFIPRNGADSILRDQMEGDGEYSLNNTSAQSKNTSNTISYISPIEGIITANFNPKEDRYGVRIAAVSEAQVAAVEKGVVIMSIWTPDSGNIIEIQHPNNTITIYKNLSQGLVSKGQAVKQGEIIGYNSKAIDDTSEELFEFELWSDGKPMNPERYIIF